MSNLAGLRVLDLGTALAAPFSAMLLGDMGAEVIKIEKPGRGDLIRATDNYVGQGESGYFLGINRGKEGITVDIRKPEGQEILRKLAADCDILIENFRAHRMAEWGLGYEDIRAINPRIIYCSISAFGGAAGFEEVGGNDIIGQAYSGILDVTGDPESAPSKTGTPVVDASGAMLATIGILSALYKRTQTGEGSHVQISLLEAAYALMPNYVVSVLNGEPNYTRQGSGHPQLVPYQAFRAADEKFVVVGAFHRASWKELCAALKREDLIAEPKFKDNWDRVRNRKELIKILEREMLRHTAAEWMDIFKRHSVLAAPVLTIKESLATFGPLINGLVVNTEHSKLGNLKEVRCPIIFNANPSSQGKAAPTLGEHTISRLRITGYSDAELEQLQKMKII
jgi:crotonobetainyl-CoA:carnitine CoA-transferase CaiB-like acyl-CoA transferase